MAVTKGEVYSAVLGVFIVERPLHTNFTASLDMKPSTTYEHHELRVEVFVEEGSEETSLELVLEEALAQAMAKRQGTE